MESLLKPMTRPEGLRLINAVRRSFTDCGRIQEMLAGYDVLSLRPFAGQPIVDVWEQPDNITDLVIRYRFADGRRLLAKVFLPVVKSKPELGFVGLDDRGRGIDTRMNLFRRLLADAGPVQAVRAHHYDDDHRVVWMDWIDHRFRYLGDGNWLHSLPLLGAAIAAVHAHVVAPERLPAIENPLFRSYLIRYPERFHAPYLTTPALRRAWNTFLEVDHAAPRSFIHGDFKQENVCITDDGAVWILDLERSNHANPAYDLGVLLAHLLIEAWHTGAPHFMDAIVGFYDAYLAVRAVTAEFEFCVRQYIRLFLSYRLHTLGMMRIDDARTTAIVTQQLQRALALETPGVVEFCDALAHPATAPSPILVN